MNMKAFLITQIPKILLILLRCYKLPSGINSQISDCNKIHSNNLIPVKQINSSYEKTNSIHQLNFIFFMPKREKCCTEKPAT